MIDLREYKDLIRQLVKEEDKKDENWKWSVKSITKGKVAIRWGYLDYCEEKNNCFFIWSDPDDSVGEWIWARRPDDYAIECYMVSKNPNPRIGAESSVEFGIRAAIEEIAHYAHSRY